jgi:signal transduction histidine kinase
MLALTYLLLRNRAQATEHYVIESRLNQYVSEYKRVGQAGVEHLATLRRGRAQQAFFVRIGDAQNRTLFLRHPEDWAEFEPEKLEGQPIPAPSTRSWQHLPSADGTNLLVGTHALVSGGVVQVGKANEELRDVLADFKRISLIVLLVFVPASFAGGAFLTSRALRPVQHLTNVAREIVETNRLDARVPSPESRDELDSLVQLFNRMLGRIEKLVRGMTDSLDNVAHDLRTPITRLRHKAQSAIETIEEAPHACATCKVAVGALADCVEETDRVSTILNTLMDIAEAETGIVKLRTRPVALANLIGEVVEAYVEFAADRAVRVTTELQGDLRVDGDDSALFRVFANLLDNALKYTPPGGSVQITAHAHGQQVQVRFRDTGIGISEGDLPRIWQRLFRTDRSRSTRGLGLGLSFVKAIVEAHGGQAFAESKPGAGTVVTVVLPQSKRNDVLETVESGAKATFR